MDMKNGLPALNTTIKYSPVSLVQAFAPGKLCCNQDEMPDKILIFDAQIVERWNGLSGNDQDVRGRLWINISKRDTLVIFKDQISGDLPVCYLLEERFFSHGSSDKLNGRGLYAVR